MLKSAFGATAGCAPPTGEFCSTFWTSTISQYVYECELFQGIYCFIAFNFNGNDSFVKEKVAWPTSHAVWSVG